MLYTSAEALRIVTALAHPVMPDATAKIWAADGPGRHQEIRPDRTCMGTAAAGHKAGRGQPSVPARRQERRRKDAEDGRSATRAGCGRSRKNRRASRGCSSSREGAGLQTHLQRLPPPTDGKITIDDFAKVELRVGLVKVAERVPKADKLLRLEVDIGTEVRQVLAGIAEAYAPETLVGRKVVIVANLAPRKLRGLESNGMIVAASLEGGKPVLASFLEDVPVGARLK